ncbi:MAG: substrate-binding domain-containing protein, partial [Thermodesulfovibrionales bacterium]|nr:substrate-binding domain-containing protein [Thermodesulfovibrionales bacterium]
RGDNSGTHMREMKLWRTAGIDPRGNGWYIEVGQGQAKTQRIANEKQAYTLTDRGTWLSKMDSLDLEVLFEGMPELFNQYGVMAANPQRQKHVNFDAAMEFIKWLTSAKGQGAIENYRTPRGDRLFIPNYKETHGNAG